MELMICKLCGTRHEMVEQTVPWKEGTCSHCLDEFSREHHRQHRHGLARKCPAYRELEELKKTSELDDTPDDFYLNYNDNKERLEQKIEDYVTDHLPKETILDFAKFVTRYLNTIANRQRKKAPLFRCEIITRNERRCKRWADIKIGSRYICDQCYDAYNRSVHLGADKTEWFHEGYHWCTPLPTDARTPRKRFLVDYTSTAEMAAQIKSHLDVKELSQLKKELFK